MRRDAGGGRCFGLDTERKRLALLGEEGLIGATYQKWRGTWVQNLVMQSRIHVTDKAGTLPRDIILNMQGAHPELPASAAVRYRL
jgi:hypothetical protein